jgi:hypothetical protein
VRYEGRDLAELSDTELARLRLEAFGFVFQQFNLIPTLTAAQNVEAALAPGVEEMAKRAGCSKPSASRVVPTTCRRSSPAVSSSASPSPARLQTSLVSCSPTSRPGISTPRPAGRSSSYCAPSRRNVVRRSCW